MSIHSLHINPVVPENFDRSARDQPQAKIHTLGVRRKGTSAADEDQLDLSLQASAFNNGHLASKELQFARKALLSAPSMNRERRHRILERIASGYGSFPSVVNRVAQHINRTYAAETES